MILSATWAAEEVWRRSIERLQRVSSARSRGVRGRPGSPESQADIATAGVAPFSPASETGEEAFDLALGERQAAFFLTAPIAPRMLLAAWAIINIDDVGLLRPQPEPSTAPRGHDHLLPRRGQTSTDLGVRGTQWRRIAGLRAPSRWERRSTGVAGTPGAARLNRQIGIGRRLPRIRGGELHLGVMHRRREVTVDGQHVQRNTEQASSPSRRAEITAAHHRKRVDKAGRCSPS